MNCSVVGHKENETEKQNKNRVVFLPILASQSERYICLILTLK